MTDLASTHPAPLWVRDADGKQVCIMPGKSEQVKGDFADHLFVKAGWLAIRNPEPQADPDTVETKPTRRKR